ncbi:MAG: hypothetical protein ABI903_01235 [Actinomycetota bacterium]
MLDHLSIQCSNLDASAHFYDGVLAPLGCRRITDFGKVIGYGTDFPTFWLGEHVTGETCRSLPQSGVHPQIRDNRNARRGDGRR